MRPFVVVTTIQREVQTTLPGKPLPQATVHRHMGELVAKAGGVPLYADPIADVHRVHECADALVINGGGDVSPKVYGADSHPKIDWLDLERDRFELELARQALADGTPVLGVCRGLHVLNVAAGGTLIQHLPDVTDFAHDVRENFTEPAHSVTFTEGSRLREIYGSSQLEVNTVHHQAADRLGTGLEVAAKAPDGIVEAIESDDGRAVAVQWHPEFMDPRHDSEQLPLFEALVELAGGVRAT